MILKVYIDGASRKNPGEAGAGIFMEDNAGMALAELNEYLGITTNNEAEYKALIIALKYIINNIGNNSLIQLNEIKFFSDSLLLVKQMKGEYSVKSPNIIPLYREAKSLSKMVASHCSFTHIPREQNKRADSLANLAIDDVSRC